MQKSKDTYCLYRHIRLDTNMPFYIGLGINLKRPYYAFGRNEKWNEIVSKYGYRVDVMMEGLTHDEVKAKEKEFIAIYGRLDLGTGILCNRNAGGQGGNRRPWTDEHRKNTGDKSRGRKHTEAAKKAQSEKQKGRPVPIERIEKMLATRSITGWGMSDKTKKKLSDSRIGYKNPISERLKMCDYKKKSQKPNKERTLNTKSNRSKLYTIQLDPITNCILKKFNSVLEASIELNVNPRNIYRSFKYTDMLCGGFLWRKELKDATNS